MQGTLTPSGVASQDLNLVAGVGSFTVVVTRGSESTRYVVDFAPRKVMEQAYLPSG